MTTILTYGNGSGVKRSCNGTCHTAKRPKCTCICGGAYHGKGNSQAAQASLEHDIETGKLGPKLAEMVTISISKRMPETD